MNPHDDGEDSSSPFSDAIAEMLGGSPSGEAGETGQSFPPYFGWEGPEADEARRAFVFLALLNARPDQLGELVRHGAKISAWLKGEGERVLDRMADRGADKGGSNVTPLRGG
jgi:hypothetical protein